MTGEGGLGLEPLPGGWSGRTFRTGGPGEHAVVRIFPPDLPIWAPEVEAAVLTLVRGLVPVPDVLEVRRAVPERDAPGLLVTSWVEGVAAAEAWDGWGASQRTRFGAQVGECAATLAGIPFLRPGLLEGPDLHVSPWPPLADGLEGWLRHHREQLVGWTPGELDGLTEVVQRAQLDLDRVARVSLAHSDLNPKNILVDPGSAQVLAVVDWEFAHAGHPATDLGNLLRLHRDAGYESAVLSAYVARHGGSAPDWRQLARCADLWALIDLASRPDSSPPAGRAARLLRTVARERDVHAWPAGG